MPQGSVLGPLLWNVGYDWALRTVLPSGLSVTCYADDTLIIARGDDFNEAAHLSVVGVTAVVRRIRRIGLEVALQKTEALCFHGPRHAPPPMRYLGLVLDGRWSFYAHFQRLASKLMGAAAALSRLLPNVGGPDMACRRFYVGVVRSMALYGAPPIWADSLVKRKMFVLLRKPQRVIAVRAIRGNRTISYEAACVLAGSSPWDIDASISAEMYRLRAELSASARARLSRQRVLQRWTERLERPSAGLRTVEAICPVLKMWMKKKRGCLTFRLTQILSGTAASASISAIQPGGKRLQCVTIVTTAPKILRNILWRSAQRGIISVVILATLVLERVISHCRPWSRPWCPVGGLGTRCSPSARQ